MYGGTNLMVDMCYKEKKQSRTAESNVRKTFIYLRSKGSVLL